jgi:hypothetical protein
LGILLLTGIFWTSPSSSVTNGYRFVVGTVRQKRCRTLTTKDNPRSSYITSEAVTAEKFKCTKVAFSSKEA